jgi:hypothetical protein
MRKDHVMAKKENIAELVISPPSFTTASFKIRGTAPYVQNKFSQKALNQIKETQEAGSKAKNKKKKEPKDFNACCEQAKHISDDGWCGMPASAFRCAIISACRTVGFKMTLAKLSVFVEADGFDAQDGTPLVKFTKGEPQYAEHAVRLATGVCDIRARPMWKAGWEADLRIRFDTDQFTVTDVANLMMRVGQQVGIGEGRPDSRKSAGMGWGLFELVGQK